MSRTRKIKKKSKSEVLRHTLYNIYNKKMPLGVTFDEYYDDVMDKLIEKYKSVLNKM